MSLKQEALVGTELTLEQRLLPLVTKRQEIKAQGDALEIEKKNLSDEIADQILATGTDRCVVGDWSCRVSPGNPRSYIDATVLLENGVSMDVIKKATKKGKADPFLDVRRKGKKDNNGEGDAG